MADNWVVELCKDWCAQYHGLAPIKQVGKHLKELHETLPFSQLQIEWRHYLAATPPQFVSIPRFALTHGSWGPETRSAVRVPYQRTVDECDAAAGIPVKPGPA